MDPDICMSNRIIIHIFPYDYRRLGLDFYVWIDAQSAKWPIAPLYHGFCKHIVYVIGDVSKTVVRSNVTFVSLLGSKYGPLLFEWGDDWSSDLSRTLRSINNSMVYVHLDHYYAARKCIRFLSGRSNYITTVLHGRGFHVEDAQYCHRTFALRSEAFDDLSAAGSNVSLIEPTIADEYQVSSVPFDKDNKISFVSTIVEYKGVSTLLSVIRVLIEQQIPCSVDIFGTGSEDDVVQLMNHVHSFVENDSPVLVTYFGHQSPSVVCRSLLKSKILLHPSYTEGYGMAIVEGLACGCTVVVREGVIDRRILELPNVIEADESTFANTVINSLRHYQNDNVHNPPRHRDGFFVFEAGVVDLVLRNVPPVSELSRIRRMSPIRKCSSVIKKLLNRSVIRSTSQ